METTKTTVLIRGQFSTGTGSKGHFTGWNTLGKTVIIPKTMMKDLFNLDTQAEWLALTPKPMIHTVYEENVTFELTDEDNKPILDESGNPKTFTQKARALSIFKSEKELATAVNFDKKQVIAIAEDFVVSVQASALTPELMNKVLLESNLM